MLKKTFSVILIIILAVFVGISQYLVNIKPDISGISKAQQIAEFTKPAVVRIVEGYYVNWQYQPPDNEYYTADDIIYNYLDSINNQTSVYSTGSGAIINPDGYIVTNAHVVQLSKTEESKILDDDIRAMTADLQSEFTNTYDELYDFLKKYIKPEGFNKILKVVLPGGDIVDGEVKSYGAPTGEGKDAAVIKIEKKNMPSLILGNSDKVALQENIWVFGYPGAADSNLLSDESALVVSITDGKVSAADKKSSQGAPVIQINAAASNGNSGGPVVREDGSIIGLLTFRSENNTTATQGFNFVVPVNTVKEFVSQAGAKNEEGDVNKLYKEGLVLYWGGYYKDALTSFEAVQRLYPTHSEIKKFITECQEKSKDSKILWSKYKKPVLAADIVLGTIMLVLLAVLIRSLNSSNKNKVNTQVKIQEDASAAQNTAPSYITGNSAAAPSLNTDADVKGPQLCCISGPNKGLIIKVGGEPIIFGRDPRSCKLLFPPDYIKVSRKHCSLSFDEEKKLFILEDHGSTSGTFLTKDMQRINPNEKIYLKPGDSFYVGGTDDLFEVWIEEN